MLIQGYFYQILEQGNALSVTLSSLWWSGHYTNSGNRYQAFNPQDPYIQSMTQLNIKSFIVLPWLNAELFYPPFSRISRILILGKANNVNSISSQISAKLQLKNKDFQILGPVPPIEKIKKIGVIL